MRGSEHAVCGGDRFANSHKHDMTGLIRVMLVHHQILQGSKSLMWYHLFYHYYIIDIIFIAASVYITSRPCSGNYIISVEASGYWQC